MIKSLVIAAGLLVTAAVMDQGAPGNQGPWPVYILPAPSSLISTFHKTVTEGAVNVNANSCSSAVTIVVAESTVGLACAVFSPAGGNATMTVQCISDVGTVHLKFCNADVANQLTTAGDYTVVGF